ncbi:MAG: serine hydrolase domain-containing protein [Maricaulaceae bacterium]|jgi:CubicO group peptidase (beta-lactamase class C family)
MTVSSSPLIDGEVASGFEPVRDQLLAHFADDLELGAQVAVSLEGEFVCDLSAGFATRDETRPMTRSTLVPVFSCSKAISALAIAWLVDQGKLAYAQPVAALWPEFAAEGKAEVTVAEALSHQAGLPGIAEDWSSADWFDQDKAAARLAAMAPMWPPGTAAGYHPISWGVIAQEIARRADGRTIGAILREAFTDEDGIDFALGLPEAEHERVCGVRKPTAVPNFGEMNEATRVAFLKPWSSSRAADRTQLLTAELPAANGVASARGLATLMQAYARQGRIGARQVIGAETIEEAIKPRFIGPDLVLPGLNARGVGLIMNPSDAALEGPRFGPGVRTVAHSGHGGSCVLADPDRGLTFAYAPNRQSSALVLDARAERLINAVYGAL